MKQREIKFRYIWQGPENEIKKYEYTLEELEQKDVSYVIADYEISDWKLLGKLQYTGLKDKNGKEIYEGDIVNFQMTRKKLVDHPVMTAFEDETAIYQGAVEWGEFGWRPFVDGKAEKIEIIGNIYENPELLK
uniref:Putative YopX protein n=1 Tax=viral metagenome TaxID=1070528 RepID=A0A6H1ZFP3_9ZZZZ